MTVDVVIIGAGAAGMICAIEAARRGRRVLVLDHAKAAGEKIRISGGGRCNFTNLETAPDRFLSQNPHFATSALRRFTQWDFIAKLDEAGIPWHEKTLGQLFCDNSAKDIVVLLLAQLRAARARLQLSTTITKIAKTAEGFEIETSRGPIRAQNLVVACGGKSIPKMGATGFGYKIAQQFGLEVIPPRPGLVPLTFSEQELAWIKPMSGTSVQAQVSCNDMSFREGLLFTHRGLSGPAILQISSYWREGDQIKIDFAPDENIAHALKEQRAQSGRMSLKNALARHIPARLAQKVVSDMGVAGNLADQNNQMIDGLKNKLGAWPVKPVGTEGYRTAEVTVGGVDTDGLDAKTMEAKAVQGLYFIGEVVDVTGWLGGYNFQWAWSSGWAAGQMC